MRASDLVMLQTPVSWFGAPGSTRNVWMRVFNVGLTTKVLFEAMAGASRQYGTAFENTACELVSQVNRAQPTGRLFSRQTGVF